MGISFLPTPKHRVFHYEPRYWNEKEEKMKERYAKYGKEYDPKAPWEGKASDEAEPKDTEVKNHLRDGYVPGILIRDAYRNGIDSNRRKTTNTKVRTIIIIVSLLLAFIAVYYFTMGINVLLQQ
ncbi:MAG: hypothetical protein J5508_01245 [Bacteroidales bacterium]|nr:hypothetical protein [Bacteroidales bacterium]